MVLLMTSVSLGLLRLPDVCASWNPSSAVSYLAQALRRVRANRSVLQRLGGKNRWQSAGKRNIRRDRSFFVGVVVVHETSSEEKKIHTLTNTHHTLPLHPLKLK
ncbi:PPR_long domain-containing protein [Pycnococcus provasolii]